MSYEKTPDRSQVFLLPPSLDDWVPQDHPVRFIDAFVESLELQSLGFEVGHAPTGRPRYSARLLLSVFLYCYFDRIRSLRRMERACLENVALMWLTGNEHPDHNTLWRFFRDNKTAIRKVLKQSVKVAVASELVGMVLHAVDGTKIEARASCKSAYFRNKLDKTLKRVDASISEMERLLEASEADGIDSYRLPEKLADAKQRKEKIRQSLAELDQTERKSLQPSEPDARVMKCGGKRVFGYNAQAVTDDKAGIIVGEDVVTDESDAGLLGSMIDRVKENVGATAETTLADKGYSAAEDLAEAETKGYKVLVNLGKHVNPPAGDKPFHASRFLYDPRNDCCICPLGNTLPFQRLKSARRGDGKVRVYHCTGYKDCPKRWQCSSNKRGRTIALIEHHAAVEKQRAKQQDEEAKAKLKRRAVIAEPPFAFAKQTLDFRCWSFRDLEGNRTQWSLMCTTINLHKLYAAWRQGKVPFAKTGLTRAVLRSLCAAPVLAIFAGKLALPFQWRPTGSLSPSPTS
jgi:transposase/DNA-binding transcriptional MerR regulator